jgi:arsenite methyltransferase
MTETLVPADTLRETVRDRYGRIAREEGTSCCGGGSDGCGTASSEAGAGDCCGREYSAEERAAIPSGANLGLGCGNPTRAATLRPGEVVLDLGSGAGVDCFLAADRVGPTGRVIGVDMTPEMVARARSLARSTGVANVEFRLGELEHLPLADSSVDVVVSNCVINLVPDKSQVYREAFRVLRPGGRLSVADIVATRPVPDEVRRDPARWASCSSGALSRAELADELRSAGFEGIEVIVPERVPGADPGTGPSDLGTVPGDVRAIKPADTRP